MKKIFVLLFLLFTTFKVFSQNHIKFMDIPLGTQLHYFVSQLKQKGFQDDRFSNELFSRLDGGRIYVMEGKFLGIDKQSITIGCTDEKIVKKVIISYDSKSWNAAYNQYTKLKNMLTQKYNKPNKCIERFSNPIPKDDKGKILALKTNKAKYYSSFKVNSGNIEIEIDCLNDNNQPNVNLRYIDVSVKDRELIDDL